MRHSLEGGGEREKERDRSTGNRLLFCYLSYVFNEVGVCLKPSRSQSTYVLHSIDRCTQGNTFTVNLEGL